MASTLQAGAMPPVPVNGIGVTAVELLCVRLMGLALVISSRAKPSADGLERNGRRL
jgi:hypothetical protein